MKRRISMVVLIAIATLNMGQSCRQETWQAVLGTFWTEIASIAGQAAGDALLDQSPL